MPESKSRLTHLRLHPLQRQSPTFWYKRSGGSSKVNVRSPNVDYRDKEEVQTVSNKKASSIKRWTKQLMTK